MYLITREELLAWLYEGSDSVDDFFADKQQVEEIASGKIKEIHHHIDFNYVELKFFKGMTHNLSDDVIKIGKGTKVKIYIQRSKDVKR